MPSDKTYDVFLSHNSHDKPRVREIGVALQQAGLSVWFDEWAILPGDDILKKIAQGLDSSKTILLFLSPAAVKSSWVEMEQNTVLYKNPTNQGRQFIPILLETCEVPNSIARFKYHDLREGNNTRFGELLSALGKEAAPNFSESTRKPVVTHVSESQDRHAKTFDTLVASALSQWEGTPNSNINPLEVFPHMNWNLSNRGVGEFDGCMFQRKQILYRAHKSIVMSEEIRRLHKRADGSAVMHTARPDGIERLWMLHEIDHDRFVGSVASRPGGLTQLHMTKRDDPFQRAQHEMNEQSRSAIQQANARTPIPASQLDTLELSLTADSPNAILVSAALPEVRVQSITMTTTDRLWSSRFTRAQLHVEMEYTLNGTVHRGYARQVFGLGLLLFKESKEWPDYTTDGMWYVRGLEFPNSPEPEDVHDWRLRVSVHNLEMTPQETLYLQLRTNAQRTSQTEFIGLE